MRPGHIIKCPITKILQAASDARRGVILHGRYVNNFCQPVGNNAGHVGTSFPLAEEISLAIDIRVVARSVNKSVLNTNHENSGRKQSLIAAHVDFVSIAVIDNDVASRNSDRLESTDDLAHDLR